MSESTISISLAPVVLFVYARPDHTARTLDALKANTLAKDTQLIVYSDAPRNESDAQRVDVVRNLLSGLSGFQSVTVVKRETNFGLARNIIEGVTAVCKRYGKVIVLEDDISTSPHFLSFMNDGLRTYEPVSIVYGISGCTYPANLDEMDDETFFLRLPLCWGWATWENRWSEYRKDLDEVAGIPKKTIDYMNFDGTHDYFCQAIANVKGEINTWFIFWYLTLAKRRALVLFPKMSLVNNIGIDGTGENCGASSSYWQSVSRREVPVRFKAPAEDEYVLERHKEFFKTLRASIIRRAIAKVKAVVGARWVF